MTFIECARWPELEDPGPDVIDIELTQPVRITRALCRRLNRRRARIYCNGYPVYVEGRISSVLIFAGPLPVKDLTIPAKVIRP